jgi:hypothetical protein
MDKNKKFEIHFLIENNNTNLDSLIISLLTRKSYKFSDYLL